MLEKFCKICATILLPRRPWNVDGKYVHETIFESVLKLSVGLKNLDSELLRSTVCRSSVSSELERLAWRFDFALISQLSIHIAQFDLAHSLTRLLLSHWRTFQSFDWSYDARICQLTMRDFAILTKSGSHSSEMTNFDCELKF